MTSHSSRSTRGPSPPIAQLGVEPVGDLVGEMFQWPGGVSDCGPSAQNSASHALVVRPQHDLRAGTARRSPGSPHGPCRRTCPSGLAPIAAGETSMVAPRPGRADCCSGSPRGPPPYASVRCAGSATRGGGPGSIGRAGLAAVGQGEARDVPPLRADEVLHAVLERDAVLRHHLRDLQRLPPVRVGHRRAGLRHHQRRVDRAVVGRGVAPGLVRSVVRCPRRAPRRRPGCRPPPGCRPSVVVTSVR